MRHIGLAPLKRQEANNAGMVFMRDEAVIGGQQTVQPDKLHIMRAAPRKICQAIAEDGFDLGIIGGFP
jgi:hypothetical protein